MGHERTADIRDDAGFQPEPPMAGGTLSGQEVESLLQERVYQREEIMVVLVLLFFFLLRAPGMQKSNEKYGIKQRRTVATVFFPPHSVFIRSILSSDPKAPS